MTTVSRRASSVQFLALLLPQLMPAFFLQVTQNLYGLLDDVTSAKDCGKPPTGAAFPCALPDCVDSDYVRLGLRILPGGPHPGRSGRSCTFRRIFRASPVSAIRGSCSSAVRFPAAPRGRIIRQT